MEVDMVDFLPIPVVDHQPVMVSHAELVGDQLGGFAQLGEDFRWGVLEIPVLGLGEDQKVDTVFGAMVRDDDDPVGFVEDLRRNLPVDYAGEDRWHGGKIGTFPAKNQSPVRIELLQPHWHLVVDEVLL